MGCSFVSLIHLPTTTVHSVWLQYRLPDSQRAKVLYRQDDTKPNNITVPGCWSPRNTASPQLLKSQFFIITLNIHRIRLSDHKILISSLSFDYFIMTARQHRICESHTNFLLFVLSHKHKNINSDTLNRVQKITESRRKVWVARFSPSLTNKNINH